MMSAVRGKDTKPEVRVRSILFREGYRFRLHCRKLPGCPDLILPRFRIAVFVHGCFWHGHDCKRGSVPETNTDFWTAKLSANKARDEANLLRLLALGWHVSTIWTCKLHLDVETLLALLRSREEAELANKERRAVQKSGEGRRPGLHC